MRAWGLRFGVLGFALGALNACAHEGAQLELGPETLAKSRAASAVPIDPFPTESGTSSYARLRSGTDAALADDWNGQLDSFGPWLETQTQSVEDALQRLAELRKGRGDLYGVASGRVALLYEHIATNLDRASGLADDAGLQEEWQDLSPVLRERAHSYWTRCASLTGAGAPHLDAWKLRCVDGARSPSAAPTRQPN